MFKYTKNPFGLFNNRLLLEPTTWNKKEVPKHITQNHKTIKIEYCQSVEKCWGKNYFQVIK